LNLDSSPTPGVFYAYFNNHAHRPRLEKILYLELSRSPNGFFTSGTAVSGFRNANENGYKFIADISHPDSSSTPGVFYTYFYNHAHLLRLEKLL
jgi:hypothetical protein